MSSDSSFTQTTVQALADVDADGMVDLVVGNYGQRNQLLYSNGNGVFSNQTFLPEGDIPGSATTDLVLGDVNNGDGWLDLLIGNDGEHTQLFLNSGDGTFNSVLNLPGGNKGNTRSIALGYFDNDGNVDVIIGNYRQSNLLLMGTRTGNPENLFSDPLSFSGGKSTRTIRLGDVNGDGFIDIFCGNEREESNELLLNNGNITFNSVPLPYGVATSASCAAFGDVTGNGSLDLIIGNDMSKNHIFLNDGSGNFTKAIVLPSSDSSTRALALADLAGGRTLNIVVGNAFQRIALVENNPDEDGSFLEPISLPGEGISSTQAVSLGDLNNDGNIDIAFIQADLGIDILINRGDGTFLDRRSLPFLDRRSLTSTMQTSNDYKSTAIEMVDVNNDGFTDIIIGNNGGENNLLLNSGNGTYSDIQSLPGGHCRPPLLP